MYHNKLTCCKPQFIALILLLIMMNSSFGQKANVQTNHELMTINGTATINLLDEYQNISGFGGVNMPDWINDLTADQVDKSFGNAPGQIGLNILRIKVPNNESIFNLQIPAATRAISHGALIMASPWSPPASMKTTSTTACSA